jgi:flagellar assembly protein FliH
MQVDIHANQMETAKADRPQGGFFGLHETQAGQGRRPAFETREMENRRRQEEANRLVEQAREQAETIQREAYVAGFAEGEKAGQKLALQKAEPTLQLLAGLLVELGRERGRLVEQHQNELIKVALLIASQILRKAIQMEPEAVVEVVDAALKKIPSGRPIVVRLAPKDLRLVEEIVKERGTPLAPGEDVRLEADPSIVRGGCRVISDAGEIDATIDGQLRAMGEAL